MEQRLRVQTERARAARDAAEELTRVVGPLQAARDALTTADDLYRTASGNLTQRSRLSLETYVQRTYFTQVLAAANLRLEAMLEGRFLLRCKEDTSLVGKCGLNMEVMETANGQWRDIHTLSGGESFVVSLSMALGLSDVVQAREAGVAIETMFVDEGFGSLDDETRRHAIRALEGLTGGRRMVGVISHVSELQQSIDRQIIVEKGPGGSSVRLRV